MRISVANPPASPKIRPLTKKISHQFSRPGLEQNDPDKTQPSVCSGGGEAIFPWHPVGGRFLRRVSEDRAQKAAP
jgi:hypothetical protein